MFDNPFTPELGEEPRLFFGRRELLRDFDRALEVEGSPVRFLILTGQHGIGKTALVRRFSRRATDAGWDIFDVDSVASLDSPADPYVANSLYDLDLLLRVVCRAAEKGVFIAVDDVQNHPIENISLVCNAVQMASRKGFDVALVLAGLPHAHGDVIQHDGCSFMRRATHEALTLLTTEEVESEFANAFEQVEGAHPRLCRSASACRDEQRSPLHDAAARIPCGRAGQPARGWGCSRAGVRAGVLSDGGGCGGNLPRRAHNLLEPLLDEIACDDTGTGQVDYLRVMVEVMDGEYVSSTDEVVREMGRASGEVSDGTHGKSSRQAARCRQKLLDKGVILATGRDTVRFAIPYLRGYIAKTDSAAHPAHLIEK